MLFPPSQLSDQLRSHFLNTAKLLGDEDPYEGNQTIGLQDVIRAHYILAQYFYSKGDGMGGVGLRDPHLLHSALSRQFAPFVGKDRWSTKFEVVATLFYGLIKNHSFHDANKRTAFLTCVMHLAKLRRQITVSHKKFEDFTVDIASGDFNKYLEYRVVNSSESDQEVKLVALYLKRNSRHIDHTPRAITYRQLGSILHGYGMEFEGPDRNFMDIIRVAKRPNYSGNQSLGVKLANITFPGWSNTIPKNELDRIRKRLGISDQDGVDSEDFFNSVDPLDRQIVYYRDALERLAHR